MRKYANILLSICLLLTQKVAAQDIHFSQFSFSPLNLSSAQAGNFDGDLRLDAIHRRQWASVTVPYRTFSAAADGKLAAENEHLKGFGAGFLFNDDVAGDGNFQTMQAQLDFSYTQPLDKDSIRFLRGGCSLGFTQKNIDFTKLIFDSQFDGNNFNPQLSSGEIPDRNHIAYFDAGAAIGFTAVKKKIVWNVDVQCSHLNQPKQHFLNSEIVRLPILWQISTTDFYSLNKQITLIPSADLMLQQKFRELNIGMEARLLIRDEIAKHYAFGIGLFLRTSDAIIPMIAVYYNKFRLGLTYDINTSSLTKASNGYGGPEISLTYISKKIKAKPHPTICPVY